MIARKKLFVIDDDPVFRLISRKMLDKIGYFDPTEFFVNGSEGLNAVKNIINSGTGDLPECIFLDIEMPVMNGWSFMEEFVNIPAEKRQGVNIYIVSSSIADEDKSKAQNYSEIKRYITKPLTSDIINSIVETL